ncbi:MAG TPA: hypothetical protein DIW20_05540, partial [Rhodospirillaceae bacterium]|nr:hypothetical protein [Rhodospirillaceae bacterium]
PSPETSKVATNMETKSIPAPVVAAPRPSQAGKTLPDAVFYDAEGRAVRLGDFAGEVLLVNLWATWCPP